MGKVVRLILIVAVIGLVGAAIFIGLRKGKTSETTANESEGRFLLKNLAVAEQAYSATHGGGGLSAFTGDVNELKQYAPEKIVQAVRSPGKQEIPWGGYYMVISEKPAGDAFKNDYVATVFPAKGFTGKTMQISKDEKIIIVEE